MSRNEHAILKELGDHPLHPVTRGSARAVEDADARHPAGKRLAVAGRPLPVPAAHGRGDARPSGPARGRAPEPGNRGRHGPVRAQDRAGRIGDRLRLRAPAARCSGMRDHIMRVNPRVSLGDAYRYARLALEAGREVPVGRPPAAPRHRHRREPLRPAGRQLRRRPRPLPDLAVLRTPPVPQPRLGLRRRGPPRPGEEHGGRRPLSRHPLHRVRRSADGARGVQRRPAERGVLPRRGERAVRPRRGTTFRRCSRCTAVSRRRSRRGRRSGWRPCIATPRREGKTLAGPSPPAPRRPATPSGRSRSPSRRPRPRPRASGSRAAAASRRRVLPQAPPHTHPVREVVAEHDRARGQRAGDAEGVQPRRLAGRLAPRVPAAPEAVEQPRGDDAGSRRAPASGWACSGATAARAPSGSATGRRCRGRSRPAGRAASSGGRAAPRCWSRPRPSGRGTWRSQAPTRLRTATQPRACRRAVPAR